ncbi:Scr1 family TA system antitoxin-like transcriptional regulator [Streptomyces sp. NPDC021093]|uniref:helix-turn-helix domain-containing protein n=1 Tax=Streptomyces sp. NPDC021093 TaxID=3365112 RepID=UPI0037903456
MANAGRQRSWEHFGDELKYRREAAGLTQEALGRMVFVSGGYIGQFEQAIRKPQLDVAQRIDVALQTDGFFERTWRKLIGDSAYEHYFTSTAELEPHATSIYEFESMLIPGLMQTAEYARALMVSAGPDRSSEQVQGMVSDRLERQKILTNTEKPLYWAIVHEAALRVAVGSPAIMAEQLDRVVATARSGRGLIQIIPFSEGVYPTMGKSLRLMEFEDAPPVAYTEGLYTGNLLDDPAMVKRAQRTYDLLRAAALSPSASLHLIEAVAEDYRKCSSPT